MIWDKAQDLGRQIGQSAEYQALRRAETSLREDKETVAKLDQIQTLARKVDQVVSTGQMPDQATAEAYEGAVRDLEMSPTGQAYVVARSNFEKLMQRVNQQISEGMDKGVHQQHHHAGMSRRGFFVVLEGPEGSGKSTLLGPLAERMRASKVDPVVVREPGGTRAAEIARQALLDPEHPVGPVAELFFYLAARADLVQTVIQPALAAGRVVLSDRFALTTEAYQMAGRGLDPGHGAGGQPGSHAHGLTPDLTLILDLAPELGSGSPGRRGEAAGPARPGERRFPPPGGRVLPGGQGQWGATFRWTPSPGPALAGRLDGGSQCRSGNFPVGGGVSVYRAVN